MMLYQIMLVIAPISAIRMHQVLVDTTFGAPMSFFESTDSSILLNRFSQDMSMNLLSVVLALGMLTKLFLSFSRFDRHGFTNGTVQLRDVRFRSVNDRDLNLPWI
jgi:hypothetical protein